jgi:hydroxyethylthiazole kinase-like uncharacterized protein yjeF
MAELLSAKQMRAIERAAIDAGAVTSLDLMERAGRGVVAAMLEWRPDFAHAPRRALVLCGPGNNGGDGFVVARLLKERGWEVRLRLYGRPPSEVDRLPADAAANARRWSEMGEIEPLGLDPLPGDFDVCIDAIFGTGLTRDLGEDLVGIIEGMERAGADARSRMICVDVPTGLCSDSGRQRPTSIAGALTVTFHRAKLGHHLADGPERCGRLVVADIGLGNDATPRAVRAVGAVGAVGVNAPGALHRLGKTARAHKYGHGHALVLSGGVGRGGAARLAARGALRIGAGLVTVGCPPAAVIENAGALHAVMLAPVADADALRALIAARRIGAVCIGPGFGHGERLRALIGALAEAGQPLVVDADAISEFAGDPETLFSMLHGDCVLTPHAGEFGRLFPDLRDRLHAPPGEAPGFSKVDATRAAAARAGCVVLFKGPDTVVADPAGRAAIGSAAYERAAPWLATAGSGDVLAGFAVGLLARGLGAFDAAETAAWLQVECALAFGPGLIAEDLPERLPSVFRRLGC